MRLLRIHAPGAAPGLAESVTSAVRAFNAELDIRLRFLAIGIEETVVDVVDAAQAADAVGAALGDGAGAIDLALLLGEGAPAVAAASTALRAGLPVVRADAGRRDTAESDSCRAVDQLAALLLVRSESEAAALAAESVRGRVEVVGPADDPGTGARIVRAVSRARRRDRC